MLNSRVHSKVIDTGLSPGFIAKQKKNYLRNFLLLMLHLPTILIFPFVFLYLSSRNLYRKIRRTDSKFSQLDFRRSSHRSKNVIFVFGPIDWDFRKQRPQQMSLEFAKLGFQVFYLNPTLKASVLKRQSIQVKVEEDVHIATINWLGKSKYVGISAITSDESELIARVIDDFMSRNGISSASFIFQQPGWANLASRLSGNKIIFDCMDLHKGFDEISVDIVELEAKLISNSDHVIVSSANLRDEVRNISGVSPYLVRNGVNLQDFKPSKMHQPENKVVIGYYGAIAHWFDADLVSLVADKFRQNKIQLIGEVSDLSIKEKLEKYPNIEFVGEVPYVDLPDYISNWSVGLIPFQISPLTLATNPVKIYEYSAAGIPTVSTALPEVIDIAGNVGPIQVAHNSQEFIKSIEAAMQFSPTELLALSTWSEGHSWEIRARELADHLTSDVRVSIVVLMWNKSSMTIRCLASILDRSDYENLEIIVVDNDSDIQESESVVNWISEFGDGKVVYIRNDSNLGFAAGNNVGLKAATGEYLVLLNNDTEVTPGWLWRGLKHFRKDSSLGLLGPSTNNCGNEARVLLRGDSQDWLEEVIPRFGFREPNSFNVSTVAFFCVIIPRNVFTDVGYLSEEYGRGYFEDDDYCRRVELKGFKISIARDLFVYHEMGASFGVLPSEEQQHLFNRNKAIYEEKWGKWTPHAYAIDEDQVV